MRTVSIVNLKGGVAKTVTSINLSYELMRRGSRVLLVDCDPLCEFGIMRLIPKKRLFRGF